MRSERRRNPRSPRLLVPLVFIAALIASCGARSELRVPHRDASLDARSDPDARDAADVPPTSDGPPDPSGLCLHIGGAPPLGGGGGDPLTTQCSSDIDCRMFSEAPYCDVETARCVFCHTNDDCRGGEVCSAGRCTTRCNGRGCLFGQTCCGSLCVDLQSDRFNCGMCGRQCGAECTQGMCSAPCTGGCPDGMNCCGDRCHNLQRDARACGGCGIVCPDGTQCVAGSCSPLTCASPCGFGDTCCGTGCFNLDGDTEHCGSCENRCAAGETCLRGTCVTACSSSRCPHGQICCGTDCADTASDPLNCGGCHHVCGVGEACVGSTCMHVGTLGSYTVGSSPQPFIDVCAITGHITYLQGADDAIATFNLPFPFTFFGCDDTAVWVSSNGVVGIGSAPSNEYNNLCLPDPFALRGTILAFWDDLGMRDGVCVANTGTPGNYAFVFQWNNAYFYRDNTTSRLDFEVVLHQESGAVDVVYRTMTDGTEPGRGSGAMATIGVVDSFGAGALQYGCNTPIVHAPMAIRFTPR